MNYYGHFFSLSLSLSRQSIHSLSFMFVNEFSLCFSLGFSSSIRKTFKRKSVSLFFSFSNILRRRQEQIYSFELLFIKQKNTRRTVDTGCFFVFFNDVIDVYRESSSSATLKETICYHSIQLDR